MDEHNSLDGQMSIGMEYAFGVMEITYVVKTYHDESISSLEINRPTTTKINMQMAEGINSLPNAHQKQYGIKFAEA